MDFWVYPLDKTVITACPYHCNCFVAVTGLENNPIQLNNQFHFFFFIKISKCVAELIRCLDNWKELYLACYQDAIRREILNFKKNERKKSGGRKFALRLFHLLCCMDNKSRVSNSWQRILERHFLWKTKSVIFTTEVTWLPYFTVAEGNIRE